MTLRKNPKFSFFNYGKVFFLGILLIFSQFGFTQDREEETPQVSLEETIKYLDKIEGKTAKKWDKYLGWQKNRAWIQETSDLSLAGEIYSEGWIGPQVSRQIVPDLEEGWLVIDTINIPAGLLMSGATLAGNILLSQVFPYIQLGPVKNRTFVNVKKKESYLEAILEAPFSLKSIPILPKDIENLQEGEQITTQSTGGFFIRAGGGIANMIGLELPAHINIGPKSKLTMKTSLKLTLAKAQDDHALISVEKISHKSNGIGFGFGLFFEDIVDIPVTIGVNNSHGHFPFLFNYKNTYEKSSTVVYDLDLKTDTGKKAYQAFLKQDFAEIELLAESDPQAVTVDLVKVGDIHSNEKNGMVNLVIWRSGFRNLFVEGSFNTTDRAGNSFDYLELESQDIRDRKWFSNKEKTSLRFSALVPSQNHPSFSEEDQKRGFVLDSHFYYEDTKTKGSEILEISEYLIDSGSQLRLPIQVNPKKNYEHMQIDMKVRIHAAQMATFLNADPKEIWTAIGYAQGLYDPYQYHEEKSRQQFLQVSNKSESQRREKLLKKATLIHQRWQEITKLTSLREKAAAMIQFLRSKEKGQLFHKTMLEFMGKRNILVRGFIRGKNF